METAGSEWNKFSEFRQGDSFGRTEFEDGSKEWREREMNKADVAAARARAKKEEFSAKKEEFSAKKEEASAASAWRCSWTAWMKDAAPFITAIVLAAGAYAKYKDK